MWMTVVAPLSSLGPPRKYGDESALWSYHPKIWNKEKVGGLPLGRVGGDVGDAFRSSWFTDAKTCRTGNAKWNLISSACWNLNAMLSY
jgi:hypothetical protein